MANGKKAIRQRPLDREELQKLFQVILAFTWPQATGPVWNAICGTGKPDHSARDRAAGFLTAVCHAPSSVPDAATRRQAGALLAFLDRDIPDDRPGDSVQTQGTLG